MHDYREAVECHDMFKARIGQRAEAKRGKRRHLVLLDPPGRHADVGIAGGNSAKAVPDPWLLTCIAKVLPCAFLAVKVLSSGVAP